MTTDSTRLQVQRQLGFDPDYLAAFEEKMFIEGQQRARRLTNFFVLLLLAATIATFGVLVDSTATVIGAMIVAPLMGPIMATAAAVVMGNGRRALNALLLVAAGVLSVIVLSILLTLTVPDGVISFTTNSQLASRIAPGAVALLVALASGAAGAFIMMREEIADSMGGVAIAISLVPPLCVVGMALGQREWEAAQGAMTLFLTNFLAILLAGGITFALGGLGRVAARDEDRRTRRRAFALIAIATILIAVPLTATSYAVVIDGQETALAQREVGLWLTDTPYEVVTTDLEGSYVVSTVAGNGALPPLSTLAERLATRLRRPVTVNLRVLQAQVEEAAPPGASQP